MRPLDGIVVLDLTRFLPGAVATAWLSNFGAEVLRVEQPGIKHPGTHLETSMPLGQLNHGKKTIAIDLKSGSGRRLFRALSEKVDVLIENFRPGVMARLGLSYEILSKRSPQLIYVALTGYGQNGPYASFAGHDLNYMSLSGLLDLITPPGGPPTIPDVQIADLAGGSATALIGILLAIEARRKMGRGQLVDVSMMASVSYLMTLPIATLQTTGRSIVRNEELLSGDYACYSVYLAKDGRWVAVAALETKFWANLCRELERPEFTEEQFVGKPRQSKLKAALATIFRQQSAEEWFNVLGHKDCCLTPVRTLEEALREDQRTRQARLMPHLNETPGEVDNGGMPATYEHSMRLLQRVGFTPDELQRLEEEGVIQSS